MPAIWESTREIFSQLVAQCEPVRFPAPWRELTSSRRTLCAIPDVESALARMQRDWDERDLIHSGLLRRRHGEVVIARRLASDGPFMVLRAAQRKRPYEIVGDRGNLTYCGLPVLDSLDDYQIREQLVASQGSLFVTTDIWDAAILRALGLAATTATGLIGASLAQLEELSDRFGWQSDTDDLDTDGSSTDGLRLVLVGWGVREMELIAPLRLSELAQELLSVEHSMQYDLQDVGIWIPVEYDLERAHFFLERNEFHRVRDTFVQSTCDTCRSLASLSELRAEPTEFVEALWRLRTVTVDELPSHSPRAALETFESAVNRELVEPMLEHALAAKDPYHRNLTVMAADISRMFFHLMPDTLATNGDNSVSFEQRLQKQLDLSSRFVAIMNALKQKK